MIQIKSRTLFLIKLTQDLIIFMFFFFEFNSNEARAMNFFFSLMKKKNTMHLIN